MAAKSIVDDFNKGDKLSDKNYNVWHRKVQYVLKDHDVLETITQVMEEPQHKEGETVASHTRNVEAYQSFKRKDRIARILLLSTMQNDLMLRFEKHTTAKELWDNVKNDLEGTSRIRLRQLALNFYRFTKGPHTTMRQHLTMMSNMISEMREAGQTLSDEQQVMAVIRSLPHSWEHMRVNLIKNDNIKTFNDVSKLVELEEDRLQSEKSQPKTNEDQSTKRKPSWNLKCNGKRKDELAQSSTKKHQKRAKKCLNKAETECFKCKKLGHFARECSESESLQQECFKCKKLGHLARECSESETLQQETTCDGLHNVCKIQNTSEAEQKSLHGQ